MLAMKRLKSPDQETIRTTTGTHTALLRDHENNNTMKSTNTMKRGDTELSLDETGLQRLLPSCMQFAFANREAEHIYQEYYANEKRSDFKVLVQVLLITNAILLMLFGLQVLNTHLVDAMSTTPSDSLVLDETTVRFEFR